MFGMSSEEQAKLYLKSLSEEYMITLMISHMGGAEKAKQTLRAGYMQEVRVCPIMSKSSSESVAEVIEGLENLIDKYSKY